MAALGKRLPSLTEGELLAARLRRRRRVFRALLPAAPKSASPPRADAITRLDSYKRLSTIGEGAFGAVSKARDRRTGEVVAIKCVREKGRDATAALLREAALLAACAANTAVVAFRGVALGGSEPDDLNLVMEFVGGSLYDVISERRRLNLPFSQSETRRFMAQLLAGVGTMHAHGIVHRDLKPGNVLVAERDKRLKICDLGLARSASAPPPLDTELEGTPGYMAPEVLLCEHCGEPVDVWALGCIMAELLTGQPLFPEDDLCQQLVNVVDLLGIPDDVSLMPLGITAAAPSKLRDKVREEQLSAAGFDVLRGLLQYDPKDRLSATAALQMPWFSCDAAASHVKMDGGVKRL